MSKKLIVFLLVGFSAKCLAFSERVKPEINAQVSPQNAVIGEVITLQLKIRSEANATLNWQLLDAALANVVILKSTVQENKTTQAKVTQREIKFTVTQAGPVNLPGLPVILIQAGKTDTLVVAPPSIALKPEKIIANLHPVKPQLPVPFTFYREPVFYIPAALFGLLGLGLIGYCWLLQRRSLSGMNAEPVLPEKLHYLEKQISQCKLRNAEVTTHLNSLLQNQLSAEGAVAANSMEVPLALQERLQRLQFGPAAQEIFQEDKLLREVKQLLAEKANAGEEAP